MQRRALHLTLSLGLLASLFGTAAMAQGRVQAQLTGTQEVPALVTPGAGMLLGEFSDDGQSLVFAFRYASLLGVVEQVHLHVGQMGVGGGVATFICSNLGNGPPGTPACPPAPGTLEGVLTANEVLGPATQGIDPGDWEALRAAIVDGIVYVNVHTDLFTGGELRGQLQTNR